MSHPPTQVFKHNLSKTKSRLSLHLNLASYMMTEVGFRRHKLVINIHFNVSILTILSLLILYSILGLFFPEVISAGSDEGESAVRKRTADDGDGLLSLLMTSAVLLGPL